LSWCSEWRAWFSLFPWQSRARDCRAESMNFGMQRQSESVCGLRNEFTQDVIVGSGRGDDRFQPTKIDYRLDDYARPIVASNRRWIVPSTGKPWLRSKARIARRVPLPMTPSMGPE